MAIMRCQIAYLTTLLKNATLLKENPALLQKILENS